MEKENSNEELSKSAKRVQKAINRLGLNLEVVELPGSTRTARDAAQEIGCSVAQIAKSLVFKTSQTGKPVLVIASGSNQVNLKKMAGFLGEELVKADAEFVRMYTGFAIGGVPPVGHLKPITTFIDRDLMDFDEIWAAAGTPHAVFKLTGKDIVRATAGQIISVL